MLTKERAIKIMAMRPLGVHEIRVLRELIAGPKSDACDQIEGIMLKRTISVPEAEFLLGLLAAPPITQPEPEVAQYPLDGETVDIFNMTCQAAPPITELEPEVAQYQFDDETVDIFESVNAELEQKLLALASYATLLEKSVDEMAKKIPEADRGISLRTLSNMTGQGVPSGMLHCDDCRKIMPYTGTNGSYDICPHCKAEQAPL